MPSDGLFYPGENKAVQAWPEHGRSFGKWQSWLMKDVTPDIIDDSSHLRHG